MSEILGACCSPAADREFAIAIGALGVGSGLVVLLMGMGVFGTPKFLQNLTKQSAFFTHSFVPFAKGGMIAGGVVGGVGLLGTLSAVGTGTNPDARKGGGVMSRLGAFAGAFGCIAIVVGAFSGLSFGFHSMIRRFGLAPSVSSAIAGGVTGFFVVQNGASLIGSIVTMPFATKGGMTKSQEIQTIIDRATSQNEMPEGAFEV